MEVFIISIVAFLLGLLIGVLLLRAHYVRLTTRQSAQIEEATAQNQRHTLQLQEIAALHQREQERREQDFLRQQQEQKALSEEMLRRERENHDAALATLQQSHQALILQMERQLTDVRAAFAKEKEDGERIWKNRLEALREELGKHTAEQLTDKQFALQKSNREQIDQLLQPIKAEFAAFKQSVEDTRNRGEINKKELQSTFENTMKLFEQQQQNAVAQLREQTERIGNDAANLSKALKGDSKMQGDWGEMILASMLENCGLRKNEEYFVQESVKDEEGGRLRPDVVVRFPEGRAVVIDSKVSLTAYVSATSAQDEAERAHHLREHVASFRRHVDELAAKDYSRLVEDAIGFVLMFVPNENSYIAAMRQDPSLSQYAYAKHVVIISPGNLLMALKLAYNLWQYDRQSKNVEQIVKSAGLLYDKVVGFTETFGEIETQIQRLTATFDKAKNQLTNGRGNVIARIDQLRDMGITPKKRLKSNADE